MSYHDESDEYVFINNLQKITLRKIVLCHYHRAQLILEKDFL